MRSEKLPPETLKRLFEASFARWREHTAFTSLGVTLRYGRVERLSAAFGGFLRSGLAVALIGALRAGVTHALTGTRVRHVVTTRVGDLLPAPRRWAANLIPKAKASMRDGVLELALPKLEKSKRHSIAIS